MATPLPTAGSQAAGSLEHRISELEKSIQRVPDRDSLCLVVFSGDLDKLLASFVMATGAAASGKHVTMFFTFWGTAALKKAGRQTRGKPWMDRMFGWMLPGGLHRRKLSKMDMGGLGRRMIALAMRRKKTPTLEELLDIASATGVEILVCKMSMSLLGIRMEELISYPGMRLCGVASFLEASSDSNTTLFV